MKLEKGAAMKFQFFHLMPWDSFPKEEPEWPVSNRNFDPVEGTEIYQTYIDTMAYAEECGFDAAGCNEHHFSPFGLMSNANLICVSTKMHQVIGLLVKKKWITIHR